MDALTFQHLFHMNKNDGIPIWFIIVINVDLVVAVGKWRFFWTVHIFGFIKNGFSTTLRDNDGECYYRFNIAALHGIFCCYSKSNYSPIKYSKIIFHPITNATNWWFDKRDIEIEKYYWKCQIFHKMNKKAKQHTSPTVTYEYMYAEPDVCGTRTPNSA